MPATAPAPAFSTTNHLASLLRARISVTHIDHETFAPGWLTLDEVISTNRLILVIEGHLQYKVEGTIAEVSPGQQIYVPAWVRRTWRGHPKLATQLAWFQFSTDTTDDNLHTLFWRPCHNLALEKQALQRLLKLWPATHFLVEAHGQEAPAQALPEIDQLRLEGEIKAILSRFWPQAQPFNPAGITTAAPGTDIHPDLKHALTWLHAHSLEPHALQLLYKEIQLSPNHFRLLFRKVFGCSPQDYLIRLRLRRARHLVLQSSLPLKQIASLVGFTDPLFFSRQYHRFWGQSPRSDRLRTT